jgi:hypothetical protein
MNTHPDIFGLDPIPNKHTYKCNQPDPYVKETTKVAEIKDRFMKTRYKVALTDFDGICKHDDLTHEDIFF